MSSVLDGLCRRPFNDFVKFCAALVSVEQADVIADLLSPEVQIGSDITVGSTTTDAVPAEQPEPDVQTPGFNWRAVMRRNFTVLTEKLDPDTGLFEKLRSRGVISDYNIDLFKVCMYSIKTRVCVCDCTYTVYMSHL